MTRYGVSCGVQDGDGSEGPLVRIWQAAHIMKGASHTQYGYDHTQYGYSQKAPRPGGAPLADALFSRVQQRVLGLLFGELDRTFYANEVIARVRSGSGAVQRELARLKAAGSRVRNRSWQPTGRRMRS